MPRRHGTVATTLEHKGYTGTLDVDIEAGELFGRVHGLRDIITFGGKTVEEAATSFRESIDFYLECCEEEGRAPDRPYSGLFNLRISPELHRNLARLAISEGSSMNDLVAKILGDQVRRAGVK
jgi:predicted HicB family RNase H-like nuclease